MAAPPLLALDGVTKTYRLGDLAVPVLRGVSLSIAAGDFVAVMGASGSGKSTLMNILGLLDVPTSGRYRLDGSDVSRLGPRALAAIRNATIGFVFQQFNLLPRTSALENVELPLLYAGVPARARRRRAAEALERMGLGARLHHHPHQLSGGQQQRVAIARALVGSARLLVADEPTGNLDSETSAAVMEIFEELENEGMTTVLVTHDPEVAAHAARTIVLRDGRVAADQRRRGRAAGGRASRAGAAR